jgi:hypothetical protein
MLADCRAARGVRLRSAMADWATISSMATAGGTLVLAIATFSSVRSGQRAARIAERSLLAGLRPVLVPGRPEDPPQLIEFADDVRLIVEGGRPAVEAHDGGCYLVMGLRNVGSGLAVLDSWHVTAGRPRAVDSHARLEEFRRLTRDIYVSPGDIGFWQGALRDPADSAFGPLVTAIRNDEAITLDVLYGDHEGGQRTISRFVFRVDEDGKRTVSVVRHWQLEGPDPRARGA